MSGPGAERRKRKRDEQEQQGCLRSRTSQACLPCRKRKVRCSGTRPCCKSCLHLHDKCKWAEPEDDMDPNAIAEVTDYFLSTEQRHVLLDIFFSTHHLDIMRQSLHRLSFDGMEIGQQSEFLLVSMYCLSALYISDLDVRNIFNGEPAASLSQRLANAAQKYSRDTSDQPSVASTQANIFLGFRELLCRTGYKAWMYTGVAIRMSQALRLGREYHQRHSTRDQEVRRRTQWTCFILDRLVASVCSRPQTLRAAKLRIQLPCPERPFVFGEVSAGPVSFLETGPDPDTSEVLPYFIKAVEYWGIMVDIFAGGVKGPPSQAPTDSEGEFYKSEAALTVWKQNLPSRMQWSLENYRTHRFLGQGSMFVSMHFILNHALCVAHQEYLPEFEGDPAFEDVSSPETSSLRSVVKTCLFHADEITRMASSLYTGDKTDREILQAPFIGVALESAACCYLWRIHQESQSQEAGTTIADAETHAVSVKQKLDLLCEILKSWGDVWPIANSWVETIDLLSHLYKASHPAGILIFEENALGVVEDNQQLSSGDVSLGSGYPYPQNLKSHRMFDNIRLIIMTAADPPDLRHRQTRLHIQNLWERMLLQSQALMPDAGSGEANALHQIDPSSFENLSSFDDMLSFMDDFQGL